MAEWAQSSSSSLDHDHQMEMQLSCSVCLDLFTDPVILPCVHSLCRKCVVQLITQGQEEAQTIKCPECNNIAELGAEGDKSLKRNFPLSSLVSIYERSTLRRERKSQKQTVHNDHLVRTAHDIVPSQQPAGTNVNADLGLINLSQQQQFEQQQQTQMHQQSQQQQQQQQQILHQQQLTQMQQQVQQQQLLQQLNQQQRHMQQHIVPSQQPAGTNVNADLRLINLSQQQQVEQQQQTQMQQQSQQQQILQQQQQTQMQQQAQQQQQQIQHQRHMQQFLQQQQQIQMQQQAYQQQQNMVPSQQPVGTDVNADLGLIISSQQQQFEQQQAQQQQQQQTQQQQQQQAQQQQILQQLNQQQQDIQQQNQQQHDIQQQLNHPQFMQHYEELNPLLFEDPVPNNNNEGESYVSTSCSTCDPANSRRSAWHCQTCSISFCIYCLDIYHPEGMGHTLVKLEDDQQPQPSTDAQVTECPLCEPSNPRQPTVRCLECEMVFCEGCLHNFHPSTKTIPEHTLVDIQRQTGTIATKASPVPTGTATGTATKGVSAVAPASSTALGTTWVSGGATAPATTATGTSWSATAGRQEGLVQRTDSFGRLIPLPPVPPGPPGAVAGVGGGATRGTEDRGSPLNRNSGGHPSRLSSSSIDSFDVGGLVQLTSKSHCSQCTSLPPPEADYKCLDCSIPLCHTCLHCHQMTFASHTIVDIRLKTDNTRQTPASSGREPVNVQLKLVELMNIREEAMAELLRVLETRRHQLENQ